LRTKAASGGASAHAQEKMIQHLHLFLEKHSGIWGSYRALPSEVSVEEAGNGNPKLTWVYPRMVGPQLEFVIPTHWTAEERFGVTQPVEGTVVPLNKIQGLLIPGLAFDRWGNRL
jgi:5-formyltetrahydrofolate cyclo-ligase